MNVSMIPKTVLCLVQPAVYACAARLYVLTHDRPGSQKAKPNIRSFYETGIVASLYESLLMAPPLADYDIRWEEPHKINGSTWWVDLWLKNAGGGLPVRIEAKDYSKAGVEEDAKKLIALHQNDKVTSSWVLAFFRDLTSPDPSVVVSTIADSLKRSNGLDPSLVNFDDRLATAFEVYRPDGNHDVFGAALIRVITP